MIDSEHIRECKSMIEPRHSFGCIAVSTSVIVVGGYFSHKKVLNSCEIYNSKINKWAMFPPIAEQKALTSACQFDGYVYIFGGVTFPNSNSYSSKEYAEFAESKLLEYKKPHGLLIERIDVSSIDHNVLDDFKLLFELEWEIVDVKEAEFNLDGYNYGCCQINTQEIVRPRPSRFFVDHLWRQLD